MTTWYQIRKYLGHRRKAKQRHGVHSPFVYNFVNKLLDNTTAVDKLLLITSSHRKLVNKLIRHFKCEHILWLTNRHGEQETFISILADGTGLKSVPYDAGQSGHHPQPDLLLIDLKDPGDWGPAFAKYFPILQDQRIALIVSPHRTPQHSAAWGSLAERAEVKLSMDLYKVGVLLFRDEFKEKQHFLLHVM